MNRNERVQFWTFIYGMILVNAFVFGYKLIGPEHHIYQPLASWPSFLIFAVVIAISGFVARAIAHRRFGTNSARNSQN
jgi:hypothetical protein